MAVSKLFVISGNAHLTVKTPKGHHTYWVEKVEANDRFPEAFFVKLLTGPNNETDYSYLGKLDTFTGQVTTTARSTMPADAYPVRLINRVLARVWCDDHDAYLSQGYDTLHDGKCGRCGRKLTTPRSIETGVGPECTKLLAGV